MDVFLAHCLLLTWASLGAARQLAAGTADRILAAAALAWGNIVLTCLILAGGSRLGAPAYFLGTSLLLATLTLLAVWKIPPAAPATASEGKPNPWLVAVFLLTVGPLAGANAWIAWTYQPGGEDVLSYHLPRAMYYLGQGNLAHFDASDVRQTHLPFNFNLLQAFGLIYGPPLQVLNLFSLMGWAVGGLAVYRLCRQWACGVNSSLLAAWLALTVPPVLAAATSATPDLAGGAALACAGVFAGQWKRTAQRRHALLAGLALGLAAGSSLGLFFLAPVLLLGAGWLARKRAGLVRAWILPASFGCAIAAPFACINLAATGKLLEPGLVLQQWRSFDLRELLPLLLIIGPGFALLIERLTAGPRGRRTTGWVLGLAAALAASWSGASGLLVNPARPLAPLLKGGLVPPGLPTLPLLLEFRLKDQPRVNIDTDGANECIFPVLVQRHHERFTSRSQVVPDAYNLLSRATQSRNAAYAELASLPTYSLLSIPAKRTAGVEFLATVGLGAAARDYFGLGPHANDQAPINNNRAVLLTFSRRAGASLETRIKLDGLNPADHLRVSIEAAYPDPKTAPVPVATFEADGDIGVTVAEPFKQLILRAVDTSTGAKAGRTSIPYRSDPDVLTPPIDWSQPTGPSSIFVTDLVLSRDVQGITSEGFLATEGPFPQWDLPLLRWAKQPVSTISLSPVPQLARLRLSFSVRLHVREKGVIEVVFNGRPVQRHRLDGRTTWWDQILDLTPQPGENRLEFRDIPLDQEPDWQEYLGRYPDVMRHLVTNHIPLEEGAREHYEKHGKSEGRTVQMPKAPAPPPDSYYFMFRNIRLEGFKSP